MNTPFSSSHPWKTLIFSLKWVVAVVAIVVVVASVAFSSDVDENARRPTCRHSKCLSHRRGRCFVHGWVVAIVVVAGSDVDVNARRPTCRLYWILQHILPFRIGCGRCFVHAWGVWGGHAVCIALYSTSYTRSAFRIVASVGRAVGCLLVWLGYQGIARFGALAFVNSFNRKGNCKYWIRLVSCCVDGNIIISSEPNM